MKRENKREVTEFKNVLLGKTFKWKGHLWMKKTENFCQLVASITIKPPAYVEDDELVTAEKGLDYA